MQAAMTAEGQLAWSDHYLVGYGPMDAHHHEFIRTLNALSAAPPEMLPGALDRFIVATRHHFQEENDAMAAYGFPPRGCHVAEHDAVLATLDEAAGWVATGRLDFLPGMIAALADWFPRHVGHMDSALAQWVVRKKLGAVPVVLKRFSR
jgi:hemerythrin